MLDIRHLTKDFAVSPQIEVQEIAAIQEAGFKTVLCNRPDAEVGPDRTAHRIREAAEAAGLAWAENIILGGAMTIENIRDQAQLASDGPQPVLAYCRTGTRSATAWALGQAGSIPTDEIVNRAAQAGYDLSPYRIQIEALAKG